MWFYVFFKTEVEGTNIVIKKGDRRIATIPMWLGVIEDVTSFLAAHGYRVVGQTVGEDRSFEFVAEM